jgi:myo-inositol-1(or 4)-monophosphatase
MIDEIASFGRALAVSAGEVLLAARNDKFRIESKATRQDLVTELDRRVEGELIEKIRTAYPGHAVLGEETGETAGDAPYQWVIDPLDGTMNYAHRYPIFSVSIAFKAHGVTEWGGICVPALSEMYTTIRGRGAYLNERELRVSAIVELADALITTGFPTNKATDSDNNLDEVAAVVPHIGDLRRSGSAAFDLAQVAAGRLDAFWEYGLSEWDLAAGALMIAEAGGRVSLVRDAGAPVKKRGLLASNGHLHDSLYAMLRAAIPNRLGTPLS